MTTGKRQFRRVLAMGFAGCCAIYAGQAGSVAVKTGRYDDAVSGSVHQAVMPVPDEGSGYEVGSYPLFAQTLAEGEGRAETESFCSICHSKRYIAMQPPLPADSWAAEVNKMVKTYGAPIPPATAQKIVQYLQANYTPETRKQ